MGKLQVNSEKEFERKLLEELKKIEPPTGINIDRKRPVAKDAAFIIDGKQELIFKIYFSQVDLVIFKPVEGFENGEDFTKRLDNTSNIKLNGLKIGKTQKDDRVEHLAPDSLGQIVYPFVILELKKESTTTHEYLTYSQKASQFKEMFPEVKLAMVINYKNDTTEKVRRNLSSFDRIFALEDKYGDMTCSIKDLKDWIEKCLNERELL